MLISACGPHSIIFSVISLILLEKKGVKLAQFNSHAEIVHWESPSIDNLLGLTSSDSITESSSLINVSNPDNSLLGVVVPEDGVGNPAGAEAHVEGPEIVWLLKRVCTEAMLLLQFLSVSIFP